VSGPDGTPSLSAGAAARNAVAATAIPASARLRSGWLLARTMSLVIATMVWE